MKHILCYGDSNTHGFIPWGGRYDDKTRWTALLSVLLGNRFRIIDEGLNGRTSGFDDPLEPYRNGLASLVPCLQTHLPLDLTILMLGSNDFKQRFSPSVEKTADNIHRLVRITQELTGAPVLLVSPIHLGNEIIGPSFSAESVEISKKLGPALKKKAEELGVFYMDAAQYASPSPSDGLHLSKEGHRALADAFYRKILEIPGIVNEGEL